METREIKVGEAIKVAQGFMGLKNGLVVNNVEAIASVVATIENTGMLKELVEKQNDTNTLLKGMLEAIANLSPKETIKKKPDKQTKE